VVERLGAVQNTNERYCFYDGTSQPESMVKSWDRVFQKIGGEIFKVSLRPGTGEVSYVIRAASRPRALLARLGYPVTRSLQARFRRDSAAAIARAIAG
jgi:hypothetical protein